MSNENNEPFFDTAFLLATAETFGVLVDSVVSAMFRTRARFTVTISVALAVLAWSALTLATVLSFDTWEAATASVVAVDESMGINAQSALIMFAALMFFVSIGFLPFAVETRREFRNE